MPGFDPIRATFVQQGKGGAEILDDFMSKSTDTLLGKNSLSFGERYLVYIFALIGFLFFWFMLNSSKAIQATRKKIAREIAEMHEAETFDEDNWTKFT
eukprot:CAMPEP_0197849526 /NCGR_PEP_ID=MMETSP1438-20131217/12460_1 /TAXON_ID=1461541 /ORGANISM="Pterosperma sp., Strain CCMP1384" /LENGTH=97 /DNA_ID=CAMNT_0043462263 /DNA_START=111 /DNA_END=404 /DNA_ORIENTATION=+